MIWNDCILIQQYLSALQVIRIKIFIFQLRWVEGAVIIYANQIKFTYVTLDHNLRHCLLRLPLQKWSIASIFITWPICYPMMGLVKVTRLFHPMNSKQNEAVFYFAPFSDQWYRRKRTPRHFERQMKKPKGHLKGNFKVKYKMCTYTNTLPMLNELWS